jgi:hypothetical protein
MPSNPSDLAVTRVRLPEDGEGSIWAAGESAAMRAVRSHLCDERGVGKARIRAANALAARRFSSQSTRQGVGRQAGRSDREHSPTTVGDRRRAAPARSPGNERLLRESAGRRVFRVL